MTSIPSLRKTSSKVPLNLLSRSWIRKRIRSKMPVKLRLRACWVTQAPVGLVVQPARWTLRLRPLATHELSMPAQKRLRRHDQSVATPCRKQSGERRKQSTIGWPQRGAPLLPAQHHQLMSQHEQLDVFGELAAPAPDQQPQHRREGEIGERKEHEADAPIARHRGRQERELRSGPASQSVARLSAIWYSRARVNT